MTSTRISLNERLVVVIIDDDDAVRESARMLIEAHGYAVRDYASAAGFLASDSGRVAVLLVDHHMPGMTGTDLLELLHAKPHPPPALVLTGRDDPTIEVRLTRIGIKLLRKPVSEELLMQFIEEALGPGTRMPPSAASDSPE